MQLKSAMMMNLESRFILCEDIGRSRSPSPNSLFPLPYLCLLCSSFSNSANNIPSLGVAVFFSVLFANILESAVQYNIIGWPKCSERVVRRIYRPTNLLLSTLTIDHILSSLQTGSWAECQVLS